MHFSVALAQNTTGLTTVTTMVAAGGNGPLVPHMRPCAPRWCFEWIGYNPPSLRMYFLEGLRVCMALKALHCSGNDALPQHWTVLRAIHTLNSPQNYIRLLGRLSPIHLTLWPDPKASCGALGGHFHRRRPWSAMVVLVDAGSWRLTSDWPTLGIVKIVYGSIFPTYEDPIHSWHLTQQLKKEDLDLRSFAFSWFFGPVFNSLSAMDGHDCPLKN